MQVLATPPLAHPPALVQAAVPPPAPQAMAAPQELAQAPKDMAAQQAPVPLELAAATRHRICSTQFHAHVELLCPLDGDSMELPYRPMNGISIETN